MNKQTLLVLMIVVALGASALLWLSEERPREPIRIGLAVNLSGQGGTAGEYVREGAMLAVEEINRNGGIHGRPLDLVIRDDANSKEGVLRADRQLADAGVIVILGHVGSQNTIAGYELLQGRNLLLFSPYAATSRLKGLDDFFLRTSVDTAQYGHGMARLLEQKGAHRVSFLVDITNPSYTEEFVVQTQSRFSGSIFPVRLDPRQPDDWEGAIAALLEAGPDAVVLLTEVSMTGITAQKLRDRGYDGPLLATTWAQTPDLMRYGGRAVEGISLVTFIDSNYNTPGFLRFSALMQQRLKRPPNARSTRAYEAITILAEALRRSPEATPMALKQALLANRYTTIMGEVAFDQFGDVERPIYEIQVRNGNFSTVQTLK